MARFIASVVTFSALVAVSTTALAQDYPMAKTYSSVEEALAAASTPIQVEIFEAPVTPYDANVHHAGTVYQNKTYGEQSYTIPSYSETSTSTVASTATYSYPIATSAPTASISHVVVRGDTLYSIGRRHGLKPSQIMNANNLSGSQISLGQVLQIPNATQTHVQSVPHYSAPVTTASTQVIRNVTPVPNNNIYAVLPGDTLFSIARRSCTTVSEIAKSSGISEAGVLAPGQRLTLPAANCAP